MRRRMGRGTKSQWLDSNGRTGRTKETMKTMKERELELLQHTASLSIILGRAEMTGLSESEGTGWYKTVAPEEI